MSATRSRWAIAGLALLLAAAPAFAQKDKGVWTDPKDSTLPADFKVQGEYAGGDSSGNNIGCQVIALGNGRFQAVVYPGGLPGDGWNGKDKFLLDGKTDGEKTTFKPVTGKRQYLAQSPDQFSATSKMPLAEHKYEAAIGGEKLIVADEANGKMWALSKKTRQSPSLGMKAPEGALVLFDGNNKEQWNGGRLDEKTKLLNTDGKDITTKKKFNNYTMHVEFLLPYRPDARGQGRGNSGFYQVDMYEAQILDSFGLDGKNNECGGIYTKLDPKVNMCLPPLQWQSYDVDFTNAEAGADGKVSKNARITLKHNGMVILDNAEIKGKTGGAREEPEGTPGVIRLQGHGNPLQFRNIWIVEKK